MPRYDQPNNDAALQNGMGRYFSSMAQDNKPASRLTYYQEVAKVTLSFFNDIQEPSKASQILNVYAQKKHQADIY